jgi:hypothetical protein
VRLSPIGTWRLTCLLHQPRMIDDDDWKGKSKYSEKTCPVPLCSPQIAHKLTSARTRTAAVGSRRLTTWAMSRSSNCELASLAFLPSPVLFILLPSTKRFSSDQNVPRFCYQGAILSVSSFQRSKYLSIFPEGRGFKSRSGHWIFSIYLFLPAAL